MNVGLQKKVLKDEWLKPKNELRKIRLSHGVTTSYLASCIGVGRKQYELKEKGVYPFNDYEMAIVSYVLKEDIQKLFFE